MKLTFDHILSGLSPDELKAEAKRLEAVIRQRTALATATEDPAQKERLGKVIAYREAKLAAVKAQLKVSTTATDRTAELEKQLAESNRTLSEMAVLLKEARDALAAKK